MIDYQNPTYFYKEIRRLLRGRDVMAREGTELYTAYNNAIASTRLELSRCPTGIPSPTIPLVRVRGGVIYQEDGS